MILDKVESRKHIYVYEIVPPLYYGLKQSLVDVKAEYEAEKNVGLICHV